jgi:hypothetical protein
MRFFPVLALTCLLGAPACKKDDDASAGSAKGGATPAANAPTANAPAANAADAVPGATPTATDCPKSLEGYESQHRVITKACGVVPVTGEYRVDKGSLTVEAGATLAFADGAHLHVGFVEPGKLIVKGTPEAPVTFTSSGDKAKGVWKGVSLGNHADRSSIANLVVEWAGSEDQAAVTIEAADVSVTGLAVRGAKGPGLELDEEAVLTAFTGTSFEDVGKTALKTTNLALAGFGEGHKLPAGSVIEITDTYVKKSVKWPNLGVPYLVTHKVRIDDPSRPTLEIAPGVEIRFASDGHLGIGITGHGVVKAVGTAEKPIVFTTAYDDKRPGAWGHVQIGNGGEGVFEHVVFEHGGAGDQAALQFDGGGTVKNSTFRGNHIALRLDTGAKKVKEIDGNTFGPHAKAAIVMDADVVGSLGGANKYEPGSRILVEGGRPKESVTWRAQPGAFLELAEELRLENITLTIEPGSELAFADGSRLAVGITGHSTLKLQGTAEKPVTLRGLRDEAGAWGGVLLGGQSQGSVLENVRIAGTRGDAGISLEGKATARLAAVTCDKCEGAVVTWECEAKVTSTNLKAGTGTSAVEKKPEGCP